MTRGEEFTGERLHADDTLFAVDLARHQAAYEIARARLPSGPVLDLGCGSGYGAASLARQHPRLVAFDRARPDPTHRVGPHFVRGDLESLPFAPGSFALVTSFQVIEHLEDPTPYLSGIARLLAPDGTALITTPNVLESDGVNPYHVHEYEAEELAACLREHFHDVEMAGVGATEPVRAYLGARSRRIRRIVRLDPLRLRERLPRRLVEWLFARFAVLVRRQTRNEGVPAVSWRDFPVGPAAPDCLDLLAICRAPRRPAAG